MQENVRILSHVCSASCDYVTQGLIVLADGWLCQGVHASWTFSNNVLAGDGRIKKHLEASTQLLNSYGTHKGELLCAGKLSYELSKRASWLWTVVSWQVSCEMESKSGGWQQKEALEHEWNQEPEVVHE
jgi:hypothetical protein